MPVNQGSIDSAYNFVPLSRFMHEPKWGKCVSQDVPLKGGLSGRLQFTLTAHTPILVGGERAVTGDTRRNDPNARFFQQPDGRYAIPGSAIRGMIRNVVEIASFSAMRLVDNVRLGVRDLTGGARAFYGNELTTTVGQRVFAPLSRGGWLGFKSGCWELTPCEFARVEHDELTRFRTGFRIDGRARPPAQKIYEDWERVGGKLDVDMILQPAQDHLHQRGRIRIRYRKAVFGGSGAKTSGNLVFTGQPGPNKHMEFFFFGRSATVVEVRPEVMNAFFVIHRDNEDWKRRWQGVLRKGGEVPVFWLDDGEPKKLGLAMMFRLAYDRSIHETIGNTNPRHCADEVLDMATLLFGRAAGDEEGGTGGLKGRVSFGLARALGYPKPIELPETVLNTPKPTYYPNYIKQPTVRGQPGKLDGRGYATYTPQLRGGKPELQRPELRGWKRYPARPLAESRSVPPPPEGAGDELKTILHPLPAGTAFEGEVRFHNLLPAELGALLWALVWGGDPALRHGLGMGKPFGFGQVSISVERSNWEKDVIPNDTCATPDSFEHCVQVFEDHMEEAYWAAAGRAGASWRHSEQIIQLLAMARPLAKPEREFPGNLRAMKLTVRPQINEFREAKEAGLVLAPYAHFKGLADADLFPSPEAPVVTGTATPSPPRPKRTEPPPPARGQHSQRFGLTEGQSVSVGGERGMVVGFEGSKVRVDFGDGPETIDPDDIDRT